MSNPYVGQSAASALRCACVGFVACRLKLLVLLAACLTCLQQTYDYKPIVSTKANLTSSISNKTHTQYLASLKGLAGVAAVAALCSKQSAQLA
jgi:hypothetical protein